MKTSKLENLLVTLTITLIHSFDVDNNLLNFCTTEINKKVLIVMRKE